MGRQTFGAAIRDIIAYATFKIFLWAIRMTKEQYWTAIYKEERNSRCIDHPIRSTDGR